MELKTVVKKIMESEDLKARLKSLESFGEVYGFFTANGYEGGEQELREELSRGATLHKALTDEELLNVAGGASGRQVLSACAGLMMLMGIAPSTNLSTYAHGTSVVDSWYSDYNEKYRFQDIVTTPLHMSAEYDDFDTFKSLVENSTHATEVMHIQDEHNMTVLDRAIRGGDIKKVRYLVEHGARIENDVFNNEVYCLSLRCAVFRAIEDLERDETLVKNGLGKFVAGNKLEIIEYLVEHGAKIGSRLVLDAVRHSGNLSLVKYSVEHCSGDINFANERGETILKLVSNRLSEVERAAKNKKDANKEKELQEWGSIVDYLRSKGAKE